MLNTIDLSTSYLGFSLKNPLVASSSPMCESLDKVKQLEDAGIGAVVLHSLFEEQIEKNWSELDQDLFRGTDSFAESLSYIPNFQEWRVGPERYLEHLRRLKASVSVPIIASLNGTSLGGWVSHAKMLQEAGADALELNVFYMPTSSVPSAQDIEKLYLELTKAVVGSVSIPVSIKLGHFFTSIPSVVKGLEEVGAKGLVLFNRFYQPDFDLDSLEVVSNLTLSSSSELRLRLRWVAILADQVGADLAVTGGVHTAEDVLKSMMAGAKVAMSTSALLKNGPGYVAVLLKTLEEWMDEHEYESIKQMQGSMSQMRSPNPQAFGRANYVRMLRSYAQKYLTDALSS